MNMHSMGFHENRDPAIEIQQMDSNLNGGVVSSMDHSVDMDFSAHGLLGPDRQQYPHATQPDTFSFSPHMGLWHIPNETLPSWHIGDDFNINEFNMSFSLPMIADQVASQASLSATQIDEHTAPRIEKGSLNTPSMEDIQGLWITNIENYSWKNDRNSSYSVAPTRPITPTAESPSGNTVDDRYRNELSLRMRPRWKEDPLPSTEFLVSISCLTQLHD
jgi:hypothetical protein